MRRFLILAAMASLVAACATVSENRIENSLRDIGVPADKASCIGAELRERLNSRQLGELADYLETLTGADSAGESLDVVLDIKNPGVVAEVTASAITCAFSATN